MPSGVRITGGVWRGRRLSTPEGVRPSSSRLREALASRWLPSLPGARILDLYAGTGAVGIELVGRGAMSVVAVEARRGVAERLRRVASEWQVEQLEVVSAQLPHGLRRIAGLFDLVFADPPYDAMEDRAVVEKLLRRVAPLLAEDGEFALELRTNTSIETGESGLEEVWRRRYGDSELVIFAPAGGVDSVK